MRKILLILVLCISVSTFAQTEEKETSNFSIGLNFGLGNSLLNNEFFQNLEGSVFTTQFDLSYDLHLNENDAIFWRFELGLGAGTYNANLFSAIGQSNLRAEYLRVPLKFNAVYRLGRNQENILSNTKFIAGIGGFLNHVYKYENSNINETSELDDIDTDFGFLFTLGLEQDVSQKFSVMLGLDYSLMGEKNKEDELKFNTAAFYIGARYRW
ncbi:outer membrane beta-barrel protein [Mesonia aquimarina]|uniref:outer membrane beta-barrel protein n=1 Tax=Mesonia aquimarina TaxID=1504967 RepID=UPI000EF58698|nr:outer membrane beta-barrel protein [Mesonia aquimarina]